MIRITEFYKIAPLALAKRIITQYQINQNANVNFYV